MTNAPNATALTLLILIVTSLSPSRAAVILFDNGAPPSSSDDYHYTTYPMTQAVQAEDFDLGQTQVVNEIHFYGLERLSGYAGSIYWSIREDDSGQPAADELAGATTSNVVATFTGVFRPQNFNAFEAIYNIDIGNLTLGPGHYWLLLHNGPLSDDHADNSQGLLLWEGTLGQRGNVGMQDPTPFDAAWQQGIGERSFTLVAVPEPNLAFALISIVTFAARKRRPTPN